MFSKYLYSQFVIHSQQADDCCSFRSRLLATKGLISLEDSLQLRAGGSCGVSKEGKMEEQLLTRGRQHSSPGNSLAIITLCTSEWGIFRSGAQEGTEEGAPSLSHRKIHHVLQEPMPQCKRLSRNLILTNSCSPTAGNGCSSGHRKMPDSDL